MNTQVSTQLHLKLLFSVITSAGKEFDRLHALGVSGVLLDTLFGNKTVVIAPICSKKKTVRVDEDDEDENGILISTLHDNHQC